MNKRDNPDDWVEISEHARGLVGETGRQRGLTHKRFEVPLVLKDAVEFVWVVTWDLDEALEQRVVAHPTFHVAFEDGNVQLYGPQTQLFCRETSGRGQVLGVKMWPGLGARLVKTPTAWQNRRGDLEHGSTTASQVLERAWLETSLLQDQVSAVMEWAEAHLSAPLTRGEALAKEACHRAASVPELTTVSELASLCGVNVRGLQRVFRDCVGVSPKWVVRCYRMHEALDWLARDPSLAELAFALEYSDQAHFSRDFKRIVGQTPAAYRRTVERQG